MLETIELYQTTQGELFESLEEAKAAQEAIDQAGLNSRIRHNIKNKLKSLPRYGEFTESNKASFNREFGKTNFTAMMLDIAADYPAELISLFSESMGEKR